MNFPKEGAGDDVLLSRYAREGSEAAFTQLANRYHALVYGTCLRRLGTNAAAEDATQAVFLLLAQNAGRLSAPRTIAPWLHAMALLVCKGSLSKEAKIKRMEQPMEDLQLAATQPDAHLSLVLDDPLSKLSKRDREAVVLRYLQGFSMAELAKELGTTPDAARMKVERALTKLRTRLAVLGASIGSGDALHSFLAASSRSTPPPLAHGVPLLPHSPRAIELAKGVNLIMKATAIKTTAATAVMAVSATVFGFLVYEREPVRDPFTKTAFHVTSYAVQPAGADRDPKFATHKIREEWVQPERARLVQYDYWKPGPVNADYILLKKGKETLVTVRDPAGDILSLTRDQALNGFKEGKWAQEPEITPTSIDFSKIEHFWKSAVVERLISRSITVEGTRYNVTPHQVTVKNAFRMTGYIDNRSGLLVRQETWSRDNMGWYLVDYDEFDYDSAPKTAFATDSLNTSHPFELAVAAKPKS